MEGERFGLGGVWVGWRNYGSCGCEGRGLMAVGAKTRSTAHIPC
jgi:hypothetical protein